MPRLWGLGADVVAVDVSDTGLRSVTDQIGATPVVMDVSEPDAWDLLLADVTTTFGGVDFAHLNAGIVTMAYPCRILDVTVAHYRRLMGVNLDGVVLAATKLVPVMARRGGAIVATVSTPFNSDSSKIRCMPPPNLPLSASFAARPPVAQLGVRIHTICPGLVRTNMIGDFVEQRTDASAPPALDPAEVAAAVAEMLATDQTGLVRTIRIGEGVRDYYFGDGGATSSP